MGRMRRVCEDAFRALQATGGGDGQDVGQLYSNDPSRCFNQPLDGCLLRLCTAVGPYIQAVCKHTLYSAAVEVKQQPLRKVFFPQLPEVKEALLGLPQNGSCVFDPGQPLRQCQTQKL